LAKLDLRYSEFAHDVDVDEFEQEIGFEVLEHARGFDIGICPDAWGLHKNGDSTGKFGIHRENRTFNCFVCGGGTLLSLTMAIKDCDEETALDWLYQFAKPVDQSDEDFLDEIEQILVVEKRKKPVWPWFNENVLEKWQGNPLRAERRQWLNSRGISPEVAAEHQIGYDPEHTRKSRSKGEYTGPAIILPHYWNERLVGWQVRWLDDERPKWVPKYTNTHDFPKEETLFGYESVYLSDTPIVVVESVPTKLFLESLGIPAVATFGSTLSQEQIRLLRKCQQGLVLARDNDPAGEKWVKDERPDHEPLAAQLERFVPLQVALTIGPKDKGGDLGDLVGDEDLVREIIELAEYY
jgi:DNA primase